MLMIIAYSVIFHVIMVAEGQKHSWLTGFYWTLTVMTTLGFGDITFSSDMGRVFSILVMLSGVIFLLIMLPFTFVEFFYAPWLHAMSQFRTPREVPEDFHDHVILVNITPMTLNLAKKIEMHGQKYVFLCGDSDKAKEYHEQGFVVVFGDVGDSITYEKLRIKESALVVAAENDVLNTKVTFTVRELSDTPIVCNVLNEHSLDVVQLAGCNHAFQLVKMFGQSLARKTLGISLGTNIICKMDELLIAEVNVMYTPLEGKTLGEVRLRETIGVTVIGIWEEGEFRSPHTHYRVKSNSILMLAGNEISFRRYESLYSISSESHVDEAPVLILGGGKMGRAAAQELERHKIPFKIIESNAERIRDADKYILGDAADRNVLREAGISKARSVLITSHDDSLNLYLTLYCRQLKKDLQIICRSTHNRHVKKLHKAGADIVMSFASMGANKILNILYPKEQLMDVEGLSAFIADVPKALVGRPLAQSRIREDTQCTVISIEKKGVQTLNPDPFEPFDKTDRLVLIGTEEAEQKFRELFRES